jgi:hypothetical protein
MGINQYQRAKKFLELLKKEKGNEIPLQDFVFAMRIHISADIRRVQFPYVQLMKEVGMIEEKDGTIWIK